MIVISGKEMLSGNREKSSLNAETIHERANYLPKGIPRNIQAEPKYLLTMIHSFIHHMVSSICRILPGTLRDFMLVYRTGCSEF